MHEVERRLAREQHEAAAFFQSHVGRARNQIVRHTCRDRRESAHGARRDDHSVRAERAARDARADIAIRMDDVGVGFEVALGEVELGRGVERTGSGDHQMSLDAPRAP